MNINTEMINYDAVTTSTLSKTIYYSSIDITYSASDKESILCEDIDTGRLFINGYKNTTKFIFYHENEKEIDRVQFTNEILVFLCRKHLLLFLELNYGYNIKSLCESDIKIFSINILSCKMKNCISYEDFEKTIIGNQSFMKFMNKNSSKFNYYISIEMVEENSNNHDNDGNNANK
jgi:hypothetical protein